MQENPEKILIFSCKKNSVFYSTFSPCRVLLYEKKSSYSPNSAIFIIYKYHDFEGCLKAREKILIFSLKNCVKATPKFSFDPF